MNHARLVCACVLLASACGAPSGVTIRLTLRDVPASAQILRFDATLDGVAVRDSQDRLASDPQVVYTLSAGATGSFVASVRAIDGSDCTAGSGHGTVALGGGESSLDVEVDFANNDPALCTVNVRTTGTGTVHSSPDGINCGTQCRVDLPKGSSLSLSANPGGRAYFAGWSGPCTGQAPCALSVDRAITVGADFYPTLCTTDHVCWESPLPVGFDLYGIFAMRKNDVWAVGEGGQILHYDGSAFSLIGSPTQKSLRAIWGSASDDIWAAGQAGTLLHYDGDSWHNISGGGSGGDLAVLGGSGTRDVWAAGSQGALWHYDGIWSAIISGVSDDLTGVYATAQQLFVSTSGGQVLRKNGDALTAIGKNSVALRGVSGSSDHNVLFVGDSGSLMRFDGSSVQKQAGYPGINTLRAAFVRADDDGWIAGSGGALLRWNGQGLTRLNTPTSQTLEAVGATAADDAWAVGDRGTILHFDGTRVSAYGSTTPVDASDYHGVSGTSPSDLWAVGNNNSIVHFDGTGWLPVSSGQGSAVNWRGVYALNAAEVWVVGNSGVSGAPVIARWDGEGFAAQPLPALGGSPTLNAVSASSASNVWIGGSAGTILRWNGASFTPYSAATPLAPSINAVAAVSPSEVWFGGAPTQDTVTTATVGCVLRWNGSAVALVRGLPAVTLTAAAVAASNDIWFSGYDGGTPPKGVALRVQNGALGAFRELGGLYPALYGVGVRSGSDVWLCGESGTLLHATDGTTFAPIATGLPNTALYGIAPGASNVSIVGGERTILRVLQ